MIIRAYFVEGDLWDGGEFEEKFPAARYADAVRYYDNLTNVPYKKLTAWSYEGEYTIKSENKFDF